MEAQAALAQEELPVKAQADLAQEELPVKAQVNSCTNVHAHPNILVRATLFINNMLR